MKKKTQENIIGLDFLRSFLSFISSDEEKKKKRRRKIIIKYNNKRKKKNICQNDISILIRSLVRRGNVYGFCSIFVLTGDSSA